MEQPRSNWSDNKVSVLRYFRIPAAVVLEATGPDSRRYLNARLTQDIKSLQAGCVVWAAALTPQGRTQGYFAVLCLEADRFLLVCDGGEPAALRDAVGQFIVADRVEVRDVSGDFSLAHLIGAQSDLPGSIGSLAPREFLRGPTSFAFFCQRTPEIGIDILMRGSSPSSDWDELLARAEVLSESSRQYLRIKAGIPAFPQELNSEHLFAESGLESAVSHTKGCYVGQEVIEKVASRGKLPRVLRKAAFDVLISIPAGAALNADPDPLQGPAGVVLSSAQDPAEGRTCCLALVRTAASVRGKVYWEGHEGNLE